MRAVSWVRCAFCHRLVREDKAYSTPIGLVGKNCLQKAYVVAEKLDKEAEKREQPTRPQLRVVD